ncbi:MAG: sulfotransferase [Desulfobacterales bacterium]|nr:sulfotransferase [Desulfobacterales bacterium]
MNTDNLKNNFKYFLLNRADLRRVHIIGCARSGTTMLHYSMCVFKNTILYDKETSMWNYPSVKESVGLYRKYAFQPDTHYIITKRGASWWKGGNIEKLAEFTRKYKIFLINLIRDPRDVMTSRHSLDKKKYYVDPNLWVDAMVATDRLMEYLKDYTDILTVRYEDVVLNTKEVEDSFKKRIGLELRSSVASLNRLKDNVEAIGGLEQMIPYMHKLRNFDPESVGRWKNKPDNVEYIESLLKDSFCKKHLAEFMTKYNYMKLET